MTENSSTVNRQLPSRVFIYFRRASGYVKTKKTMLALLQKFYFLANRD